MIMNATATIGLFGPIMGDEKEKKTSFKPDDDVGEILENLARQGFTKAVLLNACVRLAWRQALEDLISGLRAMQKNEPPPRGPKPNKGSKP